MTLNVESRDALVEALGHVIAEQRREWSRERDVIQAQARQAQSDAERTIAELRVANAQLLAELDVKVSARLAELKDGHPGADGQVDMAEVERLIGESVEKRVSEITVPRDGENGKDGQDGRSVTVEDVQPVLSALVEEAVSRAVAAIPVPQDGRDGADGKDGSDGRDGVDGKLPVAREWDGEVAYEGEVRAHIGSLFQAVRDTGREPPHEDWICIARAGQNGADGKDGLSLNPVGLHKPDGEYRRLDVVTLNGSMFIATRDDPGGCPGEGWMLTAGRGKTGKPGERGGPGQRGADAPGVVGAEVSEQGLLVIANADGSTVECDLYPLLNRVAQR